MHTYICDCGIDVQLVDKHIQSVKRFLTLRILQYYSMHSNYCFTLNFYLNLRDLHLETVTTFVKSAENVRPNTITDQLEHEEIRTVFRLFNKSINSYNWISFHKIKNAMLSIYLCVE